MTPKRPTKRPTYYLFLFLPLVFIGLMGSASAPAQPPRPLFVLLTNDDGVGAPGLAAMRSGLEEAGHRVLTVAPSGNRSGSSGAVTVRGPLSVSRVSESIYSVGGTPADSVRVGVLAIAQRPPDLVISGINEGQNVGPAILMSGTVGAALSAQSLGLPAIAVSQMLDYRDLNNTHAHYEHAASAVVTLIDLLTRNATLRGDVLLNVNHPLRTREELAGWSVTAPATQMGFAFDYTYDPGANAVDISIGINEAYEPAPSSDEAALNAGRLSVTPLNWRNQYDVALSEKLAGVLASCRNCAANRETIP